MGYESASKKLKRIVVNILTQSEVDDENTCEMFLFNRDLQTLLLLQLYEQRHYIPPQCDFPRAVNIIRNMRYVSSKKILEDFAVNVLKKNDVGDQWIGLFQFDTDLQTLLLTSLYEQWGDVPHPCNILRALSKCPPSKIKVVLLGHDPIPYLDKATGFSFSLPSDYIDRNVTYERAIEPGPGASVRLLHSALCGAGILEESADYSMNHEVWGERGVLMLNGSLTVVSKQKQQFISPDADRRIWIDFITLLLFRIAQFTEKTRLFYLCWGDNAHIIGHILNNGLSGWREYEGFHNSVIKIDNVNEYEIVRINPAARFVIFMGQHPTYPWDMERNFLQEAKLQFQEVDKFYPGLLSLTKIDPPLEKDNRI